MKSSMLIAAVLSVVVLPVASAKFAFPPPVPIDRLVKSAQAFLEKHPDDANAHYTLGRIHYLGFSLGKDEVAAYESRLPDELLQLPDQWMVDEMAKWKFTPKPTPAPLPPKEMLSHAAKATAEFAEARRLNKANALYALGEASLLEDLAKWQARFAKTNASKVAAGLTLKRLRDGYYEAYQLAVEDETKAEAMPAEGPRAFICYEAGQAFLRLAKLNASKLSESEQQAARQIKTALEKLEKLPTGMITPLVFSLTPATHLADMLAPEVTVDFDLRGFGPRERWSWVQPQVGFLVWDPRGNGEINSARQLFGSYSFEIFRRDGYEALAALDDNSDGEIAGDELRGIRVWIDADSDGRSGAGEVRDLCDCGIVAISTRLVTHDGRHPMNPRGITLSDGSTLPTWDWVVEPRARRR